MLALLLGVHRRSFCLENWQELPSPLPRLPLPPQRQTATFLMVRPLPCAPSACCLHRSGCLLLLLLLLLRHLLPPGL
jgi:hypothetical protein